jgi:ABC-type branched-subunit amino acid transport system substrate-binding protein
MLKRLNISGQHSRTPSPDIDAYGGKIPVSSNHFTTRRDFLKIGGLAAAGTVLGGKLGSFLIGPSDGRSKIGLLIPRANPWCAAGEDLIAGLMSCFHERNDDASVQLIVKESGLGPVTARRNVEALLQESDPDIVVALLNCPVAEEVSHIFEGSDKIFVVANMGANCLRNHGANTLHSSMNYRENCAQLGKWAAGTGRRGLVVESAYEAGYEASGAFKSAFQRHGGVLEKSIVIDACYGGLEPSDVLQWVHRIKPDFVYLADLHSNSGSILKSRGEPGWPASTKLIVPFSAHQEYSEKKKRLISFASWSPALGNQQNKDFVRNYTSMHDKAPSAFSALGYETGLLIEQTISDNQRPAIRSQGIEFLSPRGRVRLTAANKVVGPTYLMSSGRASLINEGSELKSPETASFRSGCWNPYLCV